MEAKSDQTRFHVYGGQTGTRAHGEFLENDTLQAIPPLKSKVANTGQMD